jgi:hypothetical protein
LAAEIHGYNLEGQFDIEAVNKTVKLGNLDSQKEVLLYLSDKPRSGNLWRSVQEPALAGNSTKVTAMEKQKVQAVLDSFGGDVDVDAFLEKVAVLDDIEHGERQIAIGETVTHDVVRERIDRIAR